MQIYTHVHTQDLYVSLRLHTHPHAHMYALMYRFQDVSAHKCVVHTSHIRQYIHTYIYTKAKAKSVWSAAVLDLCICVLHNMYICMYVFLHLILPPDLFSQRRQPTSYAAVSSSARRPRNKMHPWECATHCLQRAPLGGRPPSLARGAISEQLLFRCCLRVRYNGRSVGLRYRLSLRIILRQFRFAAAPSAILLYNLLQLL